MAKLTVTYPDSSTSSANWTCAEVVVTDNTGGVRTYQPNAPQTSGIDVNQATSLSISGSTLTVNWSDGQNGTGSDAIPVNTSSTIKLLRCSTDDNAAGGSAFADVTLPLANGSGLATSVAVV